MMVINVVIALNVESSFHKRSNLQVIKVNHDFKLFFKGGFMVKQDAKKFSFSAFVAWIVGILVSLAVGSGMIQGVLDIPVVPNLIEAIAGWVVVLGAIISIIAAIFNR